MGKEGMAHVSYMADFEGRRKAKNNEGTTSTFVHLFEYASKKMDASVQDLHTPASVASKRYFETFVSSAQSAGNEVTTLFYEMSDFATGDSLKESIQLLLKNAASQADVLMFCLDFTLEHAPDHFEAVAEIVNPSLKNLIQQENSHA